MSLTPAHCGAQTATDFEFQGRVQSTFNSLSGVFILLMFVAVNAGGFFLDLKSLYFFEVALSVLALALLWMARLSHV